MVQAIPLKRNPLQDFLSGQGLADEFFRASYLSKTVRVETIRAAAGRMMKISIIDELARQNGGISIELDQSIAQLRQGKVAVVVTGQQLGLLGGPLLTLYKIVSTIKLAREFSKEAGVPVLPIFWMQAEDQDFDEIKSATFFGEAEQPVSLSLDSSKYATGDSIGNIILDPNWSYELEAFVEEQGLGATEFATVLKDSYKSGATLTEAFGALVRKAFARFGLVVFNPLNSVVKEEHRDFIASSFLRTRSINSLLEARADKLETAGYEIQVKIKTNSPLFFLSDGKRRERLLEASDGSYSGLGKKWTKEEIFGLIDKEPGRFTTSALIRPIFQDTIFPTAAYVCGPAEFNYWVQLKPLYEYFNAFQPLVIPRARFVVLERKYGQLIEKTGVTLDDLKEPIKELISRRFQNTKYDPEKLLGELTHCFTDRLNETSASMLEIDPNLKKALDQTAEAVSHNIARLKEKYQRSLATKEGVVAGQLERLKRVVSPESQDQERLISWVQYVLLYGDQFIDAVYAAADPLNVREMSQLSIG